MAYRKEPAMSLGCASAVVGAFGLFVVVAWMKISAWRVAVGREAAESKQTAQAQDQAVETWERRAESALEAQRPATLGDASRIIGRGPDECRQFKSQFREYTAHWSMLSEGGKYGLVTLIVENCTPAAKVVRHE